MIKSQPKRQKKLPTSSNNGKDKNCHKRLQEVNAIKKINHASATKLSKKTLTLIETPA